MKMKNKKMCLNLDVEVVKAAKMAAARKGITMAGYVAILIWKDAEASGIAALINTGDEDPELSREPK